MYTVLLIFHVIFCLLLVAIVLLQVGRGRGMLGFLGGGTAESLFGSKTGDVLTKSTTAIAIFFMVTSLSLAYLSVQKGSTVMKGLGKLTGRSAAETTVPAAQESGLMKKGAGLLDNVTKKISESIPNLVAGDKQDSSDAEGIQALKPKTTTKTKVNYDASGNKIEDSLVYDANGKLVGHTKTTYDRFDKKIAEEKIPLEKEITTESLPAAKGQETEEASASPTEKL